MTCWASPRRLHRLIGNQIVFILRCAEVVQWFAPYVLLQQGQPAYSCGRRTTVPSATARTSSARSLQGRIRFVVDMLGAMTALRHRSKTQNPNQAVATGSCAKEVKEGSDLPWGTQLLLSGLKTQEETIAKPFALLLHLALVRKAADGRGTPRSSQS